MTASLRKRAHEVAADLVTAFPSVESVCLFGSVARGDDGPTSDIDLFVIGTDPQLTPLTIRERLGLEGASPRVSIVCHTPDTFSRYVMTGSRFLVHLQLEGEVLFDREGRLHDLQEREVINGSSEAEIMGQLRRLALYDDTSRYNGNFLFPLSHIYAIGKAIVMAILAEHGIYEFGRTRAFEAFADRFPETASSTRTIERLAPFYSLASKGVDVDLPFSYHACEEEVHAAIRAVRQIAIAPPSRQTAASG